MRKIFCTLVLLLSVTTFAGPVKRFTEVEARNVVEKSKIYEELLRLKKDPANREKVMAIIDRVVRINLKDVVTLDSTSQNSLVNLVNVSPLDVMSEIARLSSISKDPTVSAREKRMAQTTLELMAEGAKTISGVTRSAAEAKAQQAQATKVLQLSNKIASLSLSPSAKKFVESYKRALREGKNADEAVKVASNGKFTEKELRECE